MYWLVIIFDLFSSILGDIPSSNSFVNLSQGPVRGYKDLDLDVFVFYGIPYATAPTGQEKFKAPLPPPVWSEPFEAVNNNIICPQIGLVEMLVSTKTSREDCLVANVYTPETNGEQLPVLVHFHPGAYMMGYGDISHSENLVKSKKIVAVTFNHRLGAHGFLCLGTKDVPGNAGMKDQVALLRWVKKNIANFGGNPDEVTISGINSGSSAVDLLMISKMARGLFKRVIPENGANTAAFSVQPDPIKNAQSYADMLKFENVDNFYELESFYKNLSCKELNSKNLLGRPDSTFLMSPCVERDVGEEMFLDDNPVNILKSGDFEKLPMLYGFGEAEGQIRLPFFEYWEYYMNVYFLEFLPADLQFKTFMEKADVAEDIKQFYFGDKVIGKKTTKEFVEYFTDVMFAYPTLRSVKLQVEAGNNEIYLYMISQAAYEKPTERSINVTVLDQCSTVFEAVNEYWEEAQKGRYDPEDLRSIKEMIPQVWLNFIIKGEPIIPGSKLRWKPVGADWSPYMHIDRTFKRKRSLLKKRVLFWENIYEKYYRYPSAPPAPPPKTNEI